MHTLTFEGSLQAEQPYLTEVDLLAFGPAIGSMRSSALLQTAPSYLELGTCLQLTAQLGEQLSLALESSSASDLSVSEDMVSSAIEEMLLKRQHSLDASLQTEQMQHRLTDASRSMSFWQAAAERWHDGPGAVSMRSAAVQAALPLAAASLQPKGQAGTSTQVGCSAHA